MMSRCHRTFLVFLSYKLGHDEILIRQHNYQLSFGRLRVFYLTFETVIFQLNHVMSLSLT